MRQRGVLDAGRVDWVGHHSGLVELLPNRLIRVAVGTLAVSSSRQRQVAGGPSANRTGSGAYVLLPVPVALPILYFVRLIIALTWHRLVLIGLLLHLVTLVLSFFTFQSTKILDTSRRDDDPSHRIEYR